MVRISGKKVNAILSLLMITAMLFGSAVPVQAVDVGNDTINFIGYRYDYPEPGVSTWYYEVTSGASPAISHVTFALNLDCLEILDAGTWDGLDQNNLTPDGGNPVIGTDPTTGVTGLKFDQGFNEGETRYYYFTVDNNYAVDMITIASKGGNDFETALIEGPSGTCEYYPPNPNPAIDIEKNINGQDVDNAPGLTVTEGDLLTFDFIVTNTGNVDLANVSVTDNVFGAICTLSSLAVGASHTCMLSGLAAVAGQHTNIGTATGSYNETTVSDSDAGNYFAKAKPAPKPGLKIKKYVNGKDADEAPGITVAVGSTVTFTYIVGNIGTVTLANIMVVDNILGQICTIASLEPGQTATCTATSTAIAGQYMNIGKAGTWYGDPKNGGIKVTASDRAYYFGE